MPGQLVTTLVQIGVSVALFVLILLAPTLVWAKMDVAAVAQAAARVAATTQDSAAVQNEIVTTLEAEHMPTTYNGQTLFTFTESAVGQTGYNVADAPASAVATVSITYQAPLPFDRVLTLLGGAALAATIPVTETASAYNESQYTGTGGA